MTVAKKQITYRLAKDLYRTEFSFSKEELEGDSHVVNIGYSGFNYSPSLATDETALKEFRKTLSFDYGSINPQLNPSDIIPKPEDFMPFEFRLLSATVVAPYTWRATEFPESVLKASTQKLSNKPVFTSHYTSVDNVIGKVKNPVWSGKKQQDGQTVPAGIDGILLIDTKIAPRVARNLLTGNLFSNSVTVVFDWKPSHNYDSQYEFRKAVGTLHKDGTMVRRIATTIIGYRESSVVFLGADPYAKMKDKKNGALVQVDYDDTYNVSFEKESEKVQNEYEKGKNYFISCGFSSETLSLAQSNSFNPFKTGKIKPKMKENVLKALLTLMGLPVDTDPANLSEAQVKQLVKLGEGQKVVSLSGTGDIFVKGEGEKFTAITNERLTKDAISSFDDNFVAKTEFTAKTTEVETLTKDKKDLENKVKTLEPLSKIGEGFITKKRAEVIRLYKAANIGKVDNTVVGLFEKANAEELDGLLKQYVTDATELAFKGKCTDCGGTEFSFQSSLENDPTPAGDVGNEEEVNILGLDDLREMYNPPTF